MSDLERWALANLPPLIAGQPLVLSPDDQERMATWAVKTAFTVEWTYSPSDRMIPDSHPRTLFTAQHPPVGAFVFTARYPGGTGIWQRSLRLPLRVGDLHGLSYDYASTFTIGEMFVQVVGMAVDTGMVAVPSVETFEAEQLWPPVAGDGYEWPPRDLSDGGRDDSVTRWTVIERAAVEDQPNED